MLLLIFQAGGQTYGLDTRKVMEVVPYPFCTPLPHAPVYVAGLASWRGNTVPVIDLPALVSGIPARPLLSTRLLVVDYGAGDGRSHPLGLLAEKAVETILLEETSGEPQKVKIPEAAYLDGTIEHEGRLIQRVALEELLPNSVQNLLVPPSDDV